MADGAKWQCGDSGEDGEAECGCLQREALETRWIKLHSSGFHWFEGNNDLVG